MLTQMIPSRHQTNQRSSGHPASITHFYFWQEKVYLDVADVKTFLFYSKVSIYVATDRKATYILFINKPFVWYIYIYLHTMFRRKIINFFIITNS
jgi:hypothetical protein